MSETTDEQCLEVLEALHHHSSMRKAARALNMNWSTFRRRLLVAESRQLHLNSKPIIPDFGDDDIPVEDIIDIQTKRFHKRFEHKQSKDWFPIKMATNEPCVLALVGDPHLDDDGCNWPQLTRDVELMSSSSNVHAVNLGDATNNWTGRLMRLYAHQETSKATGYKLVRWLMHDSKVPWLLWLLGNHDDWGDGALVIKEMSQDTISIFDWQAKFKLVWPNKRTCPIWLAHSFKGNSIYNILHGPMRAIKFGTVTVRIAAQGHHHEWGYFVTEDADTCMTTHAIKARGYKHIDSFADRHGYQSQQQGSTMAVVIDPREKETSSKFITVFPDLEHAINWKDHLLLTLSG